MVPAGLLAGDEYSVTSCTKPVSGRGWGDLKHNCTTGFFWLVSVIQWVKKAANILGITWITSKYHFSGTTGTSGCREAGRAVGGKDVILLQHPLRWEWRCPGSFIISSLILFNSDFWHTSAMWVYFSECENAFIFCWQVWSLWRTNGCATVAALGLSFVSRGKKPFQRSIFIS